MPENVEAVEVFISILPLLDKDLVLPGCTPWLFKVLDVTDERGILEKITILRSAMRNRAVESK